MTVPVVADTSGNAGIGKGDACLTRLVDYVMSPEAVAATARAIASATSLDQLDALQRSLERAYRNDAEADDLLARIVLRRRDLGGA